jgi:hypothetical protein
MKKHYAWCALLIALAINTQAADPEAANPAADAAAVEQNKDAGSTAGSTPVATTEATAGSATEATPVATAVDTTAPSSEAQPAIEEQVAETHDSAEKPAEAKPKKGHKGRKGRKGRKGGKKHHRHHGHHGKHINPTPESMLNAEKNLENESCCTQKDVAAPAAAE